MAQKWHLRQELLKSTSKIWKFNYDSINYEVISYIVMEDLKLWQIKAEVVLKTDKLKALNPSF